MPSRKLKAFLDEQHVKYVSIQHSRAYTASEIAASAHVSGREFAKTVIVKLEGELAMAVLPSSHKVDFDLLGETAGAQGAELATEAEFRERFPDCDVGAMPPFGNLYAMDTYVAEALTENAEIVFNAGTLTELIRMRYADFARLVNPVVLRFAARV